MASEAGIDSQLRYAFATTRQVNRERDDPNRSKRLVKRIRQRSSSSLASSFTNQEQGHSRTKGQLWRSSSLSMALEQRRGSFLADPHSSITSTQGALKIPREVEAGLASLKSELRTRKGIRLRKVISSIGRRFDGSNLRATSKVTCRQANVFASEEDSGQYSTEFSFTSAHMIDKICQSKNGDESSHSRKGISHSSTSLSYKYQPKQFQDISGNEIVVKAISNAVQRKMVAPLYLFHGPSGTGKTCTARILAMALNCESTSLAKPCWSCIGCSRSLYIMELCSGRRISGFESARTLLQSTAFTQTILGFKVFIIEECHSLSEEAWEQLLGMVERGYDSSVVFVMITEDANKVPRAILSRCQKFSFTKLKDMDITLKLERIVAREDIAIELEALKLIVTKAEGSLREAENIVDQLALLGSKIKCSMVQQLVGLVPHNKLTDLLTTALSADTSRTVRLTRELIASGAQPQALVSQLASLITDILSGCGGGGDVSSSSAMTSRLVNAKSEKLCSALKILVDTEKQLASSRDRITWVVAALLQITSEDVSDRSSSNGIALPRGFSQSSDDKPNPKSLDINWSGLSGLIHQRNSRRYHHSIDAITSYQPADIRSNNKTDKCRGQRVEKGTNLAGLVHVDEIWENILGRMQSTYVKELLRTQAKLASLTLSSANAIVHLLFKRPEDKQVAQISEESISKAMEHAIGCPVTVNMSLEPIQLKIGETNGLRNRKGQEEDYGHSSQRHGKPFLPQSESSRSRNELYPLLENNFQDPNLQESANMSRAEDTGHEASTSGSVLHKNRHLPGHLSKESQLTAPADPQTNLPKVDQASMDSTYIPKSINPKYRLLSLPLIQQGDASIEQYSQDLVFENANTDRMRMAKRNPKLREGVSKATEDHVKTSATQIRLHRSRSCAEILCQGIIKVRNRGA